MLTIHSPKFSTGKTEITKNSPTFRQKRAPSLLENYAVESRPKLEGDSPAKLKRRSRLDSHPGSILSRPSKDKGAKEIIDSIQNLKEEYKTLKEAYRELIH